MNKKQQHEITDGDISFVSFVRKGANRSPFKIRKSDDEESLFMKNLRKASFQPPATRGEEDADTAEKARRRAQVEAERALEEKIVRLQDEYRVIETMPGVSADSRQRTLHELAVQINDLRQALHATRDPLIAKSVDQFDLMMLGISPAHAARGGRSQTISANLPSEISKGGDAQLAADLRSESLGVRRTSATVKKSDDDELLSNPLGLRTMRKPS